MSKASLELGGGNWGTKDGNLLAYAQGNESSNLVPREFTFTRGSDIAATRVNSSGVIEKYRENLLLQSNQFDTTWTLNSTSVTSGQSGYDGSSDAWLLNSTTTGFPRIEQLVSASGVNTYSVYAKPATDGFINMRIFGADAAVWFNANDGLIANASGSQYVSSNIQSVGNGWYRCSVVVNGSITSVRIYPASSYGVYSTSGNGVYIQDAQLEAGLVATSYLESGATTATSGVADNEPRIDYTGGTASLLLEPSRTNSYIYHSEYITSSLANISREISNVDSPIKDTPFLKITKTGTGISRFPFTSFSTNGDFDTCSVFAKAGSSNILLFADSYNGLSTVNAKFNLTNGDWDETPSGSALHDYGFEDFGNGMYRVWVCGQTYNTDTPEITARWRTPAVYCDIDQLPLGEYIYITGMQTEKNATYPTSYIPNHSGGSVTRVADDVNYFDVSSMLTGSNFTLFLDLNDYIGSDINSPNIWLQSTSSSIYIEFRVRPDGYRFYYNGIAGGSAYPISGSTTANKFCISYDGSNYRLYLDGVLQATTASVGDGGWDKISNQMADASLPLKQMKLFPTTLTDREAVDLTSPYSTYQELVTAEGLTWESPTCTTNSITELQSI